MSVEFGKIANLPNLCLVFMFPLGFVWRQFWFAFFGALTSVGALFILPNNKKQEIFCYEETFICSYFCGIYSLPGARVSLLKGSSLAITVKP